MKRFATALIVGSLLVATQAASADDTLSAIPDQTQPYDPMPSESTYADAHTNDPVPASLAGSAIPDERRPLDTRLVGSTYADAHANDPVPASLAGSAIPDERRPLDTRLVGSTYADTHLKQSSRQEQGKPASAG
jgi:hypothetical protein